VEWQCVAPTGDNLVYGGFQKSGGLLISLVPVTPSDSRCVSVFQAEAILPMLVMLGMRLLIAWCIVSAAIDHVFRALYVYCFDAPTYTQPPAVLNAAPVITSFAAVSTSVTKGSEVTVIGEYSDADGNVLSVTVDWNDGTASSTSLPARHAYTAAGLFSVTLTVTDSGGLVATQTVGITVTEPNTAPMIGIVTVPAATTVGSTVRISVPFTDDDTGDTHKLTVDWGDSTSPSIVDPVTTATAVAEHMYTAVSTRTITCTITDSRGLSDTETTAITVTAANSPPVITGFAADSTTVAKDTTVTVSAASITDADGDVLTYTVDWGDSTAAATTLPAAHAYSAAGIYTVKLTATDSKGSAVTATTSITVTNKPVIGIVTVPAANTVGSTVRISVPFTDDDTGDTHKLTVDWGDSTSPSIVDPVTTATAVAEHVYTAVRTRTITCTITDSKGLSATKTAAITVTAANLPPVITGFAADSTSVAKDTTVTVSASITDADGDVLTYTVDWGDSTAAATTLPAAHAYSAAGIYTVKLTATDSKGSAVTATTSITVTNKPVIGIVTVPAANTVGSTVRISVPFTDGDTGDTHKLTVDWGDSTSPSIVDPVTTATAVAEHVYTAVSTRTITCTITDSKLSAAKTVGITVTAANAAPVITGVIVTNILTAGGNTVSISTPFTDANAGDTHKLTLNWGDNTAAVTGKIVTSPAVETHVYAAAGTYTVTATITDNSNAVVTVSSNVVVSNAAGDVTGQGTSTSSAGTFVLIYSVDSYEM
jgi:large repetitive protein